MNDFACNVWLHLMRPNLFKLHDQCHRLLAIQPLETGGVGAPQSSVEPQPDAVCIYCLVPTLHVSVWHTQPGAVLLIMFLTEMEKSLLKQ